MLELKEEAHDLAADRACDRIRKLVQPGVTHHLARLGRHRPRQAAGPRCAAQGCLQLCGVLRGEEVEVGGERLLVLGELRLRRKVPRLPLGIVQPPLLRGVVRAWAKRPAAVCCGGTSFRRTLRRAAVEDGGECPLRAHQTLVRDLVPTHRFQPASALQWSALLFVCCREKRNSDAGPTEAGANSSVGMSAAAKQPPEE